MNDEKHTMKIEKRLENELFAFCEQCSVKYKINTETGVRRVSGDGDDPFVIHVVRRVGDTETETAVAEYPMGHETIMFLLNLLEKGE